MKKVILFCLLVPVLFACKDEEKEEAILNSANTESYYPLAIGNYWVYNVYATDTTISSNRDSITTDSMIITKDTIINGEKFYCLDGTDYINGGHSNNNWKRLKTIRDSVGYIIDINGKKIMSYTNFLDTLKTFTFVNPDTIYNLSTMMEKINSPIITPAGIFNVINCKGTVISTKTTQIKYPRHIKEYYAKDIGLVYQNNIYIFSSGEYEKELIRYHIVKE